MTNFAFFQVLFTYDDNDEMVLHQLGKFDGRTVTSAETYLSTSEVVDDAASDTTGTRCVAYSLV